MRKIILSSIAVLLFVSVVCFDCLAQESKPERTIEQCMEAVREIKLEGCEFTTIELVADGRFDSGSRFAITDLPLFCRVAPTLKPSENSDIKIEVWLPEHKKWNGRLLGAGNGGSAGSIIYNTLANGVKRNFATGIQT